MAVCCSSPLMSAGASGRSYAAQGDLCVACGESCVGVCEESCAAVGCMEAAYRYERSSGPTTLAYVGTGGDYIQETTYKYIGGGAGDYGMVAMPKARSSNNVVCICCILPLLLSLGMGLLLLSVLMISNTTTTTTTTRTTSTSLPILVSTESAAEFMYDCSGNQEFWSKDKLAWCCIQEEIGCPTAPPPESGADLPPEIRAELPPEPSSVAPSTPPSTTAELDCDQCENGGCPAPERTRCCLRFGKACPTTPLTTLPPPPPPPPKPTPPPLPPPQPQPATPPPPPPTTASTTTPCPIDCNVGYNDLDPLQWVKGWSGEKKLYCCKTVGKGCPSELPPPSGLPPSGLPPEPDTTEYDCDAGYHHCMHCLVESWSPPKIDFCCKTQHKGCKGEEPP